MSRTVAIIGRPNVGKSSLFNRIIGERLSITDDASGVTRDRIYAKANWLGTEFSLIDTGGVVLKEQPFSKEILAQAEFAIDEADVIIMVTDVRVGLTQEDEDVAKILRKSKKPVLVAVNKVDDVSLRDAMYDFYNLGFEELFAVSTVQGIGIGDLLDRVLELLPKGGNKVYPTDVITFCLIGQPNVGKSTLANTLVGKERSIVSDIAGTTRDAIDTPFAAYGKKYVVIDTAGLRKQGKIYENAEKFSFIRSLQAIERSEIAVILLDATQPITEQDKRIAGYARSNNRAMIFVVNKWDLLKKDNDTMGEFVKNIRNQFEFLDYVPIIFMSAMNNKRVNTLIDEINHVDECYRRRVQTSVLNDLLQDAVLMTPPPMFNGNRLKLSYATQGETMPPEFVLFVNDERHMHFSYLRYLENTVREHFDFTGSPVKFTLRRKDD